MNFLLLSTMVEYALIGSMEVIILVIIIVAIRVRRKKLRHKALITKTQNYNVQFPGSPFKKLIEAEPNFLEEWNYRVERYNSNENNTKDVHTFPMVVDMVDHRLKYIKTLDISDPLIIKLDSKNRYGKLTLGVYDKSNHFIGYISKQLPEYTLWIQELQQDNILLIGSYAGLENYKPKIDISVISSFYKKQTSIA
ncbi:hypothetical protein OAT16_00350 [Prolixibacteraceae bacterium]|nr:hypothetical protein [Prolixibacteraceae bacterium]